MKSKKRILVAPLDWGLGHATRCIPVIKGLINNDFEVIIAADKRPLHLLMNEFPDIKTIRLPGYNVSYSQYLPMSICMLLQSVKFFFKIQKEQNMLKQIIKEYSIDGVISDNRFGLSSKQVPCIFITHQLKIKLPWWGDDTFSHLIQRINYHYIKKYTTCWIMDCEKENIAGELSNPFKIPKNSIYIGTRSRFIKKELKKKYDFIGIISGPEPQRTIFENGLIKALQNRKEKSLIVLGKPELNTEKKIGNLTIISHLNSQKLNTAILQSELVICRSGYSTIMDLIKLEKNAFFIPTPGQTEQEYLARVLMQKKICYMQKQSEFNLELGIYKCRDFSGFKNNKHTQYSWKELLSFTFC